MHLLRWSFRHACAAALAGIASISATASAGEVFSSLASQPSGRISFTSVTPKNLYALHKHAGEQPTAVVNATLYLPEDVRKPVPAMVITPGSGGIMTNQTERWAPLFLKLGVAVLLVDTLGSRHIESTVSDQAQLSYAADVADSFYALNLLATDPRIDPARIGQIGFSRGGAIALDTLIEPFRAAVLPQSTVRFAVHVAVYAACDDTYWNGKASLVADAPVLFLMAEKDEAVSNALCLAYAAKLKAILPRVETRVYEGAHHDFDAVESRRVWISKGINNRSCPGREFDPTDWSVTDLPSGRRYATFAEYAKAFPDYCGKRGYTIEGHPAAARQAEQDVAAFLRATLNLP